jgi:UDP-N-acetylmuramate--alanine ligase
VIGGRLNSAGANAKLGSGDYIVVEADESDASFLNLLPVMAVVTNIDADHMETYGHDFGRLKGAFVDFLHRMPFYGTAILCTDDPAGARHRAAGVLPHHQLRLFGRRAGARRQRARRGGQMHFTVQRRNGVTLPDLEVVLNLAGEHNVLNALSAIAVAVELNIPTRPCSARWPSSRAWAGASSAMANCPPRRRPVHVIDDYGHHPVEMAATLAAARGAFPGAAWCWPSSRTATRARATASRIS